MTTTVAAAAARTLGDLVVESPAAVLVLDRYGLDYCCQGHRTLAEACATAGLDAARISAELDSLGGEADNADAWASLAPSARIEHIVATHYRYQRDWLPLLEALATKVLGAHGERHPELADVERLVRALRDDIEPHLDKEERVLFPAIRALVDGRRDFRSAPSPTPYG
jgi:regulator of cell morphogenesis and NO signaling